MNGDAVPGLTRRPFIALLALLANAILIPILHSAQLSDPARVGAVAHQQIHAFNSERQLDGPANQVCHFCRLLGIALPPPPSVAVEISFGDGG